MKITEVFDIIADVADVASRSRPILGGFASREAAGSALQLLIEKEGMSLPTGNPHHRLVVLRYDIKADICKSHPDLPDEKKEVSSS